MIAHAARIFLLGIIIPIGFADAVRAQSTDALYERAKAEGSVTLYGAGPPEPFKRWIKDFQQQYPGVTIEFAGGLSNALDQKIEQQIAAHKMAADVGIFQTMQDFVRWKQQGALMLFRPDGFDKIDSAFKDEDGAFTTVSVNLVTYAYNTKGVSAADVPKSALDFLKPMFKGRLITSDPSDDDAGLMAFHVIVDKYGWDYMTKYMAMAPHFTRDGHAVVSNAVAAGDALATFEFDLDHAAADRGRQADPDGAVASRSDAGVLGGRRDLCRRATPQRGEIVPRLVSRARPAAEERRLLGPVRRAAAPGLQAVVGLQSRPQLPRAAFRSGAACGIETPVCRICEPQIDRSTSEGRPSWAPGPSAANGRPQEPPLRLRPRRISHQPSTGFTALTPGAGGLD